MLVYLFLFAVFVIWLCLLFLVVWLCMFVVGLLACYLFVYVTFGVVFYCLFVYLFFRVGADCLLLWWFSLFIVCMCFAWLLVAYCLWLLCLRTWWLFCAGIVLHDSFVWIIVVFAFYVGLLIVCLGLFGLFVFDDVCCGFWFGAFAVSCYDWFLTLLVGCLGIVVCGCLFWCRYLCLFCLLSVALVVIMVVMLGVLPVLCLLVLCCVCALLVCMVCLFNGYLWFYCLFWLLVCFYFVYLAV